MLVVTNRWAGDTAVVSVERWNDPGRSCTWRLYRGRWGWQADYPSRWPCGVVLLIPNHQFQIQSNVIWQLDWPDH
jgi:hypothetical protein